MPTVFLCLALIGALMTANAFVAQRRFTPFIIPSFFAGWLVSELPLHHIVWQAIATVGFVAGGALDAWPGQVGLVITLVSWMGLLGLRPIAASAEGVVEDSLAGSLGADYRQSWTEEASSAMEVAGVENRFLWAFKMRHPKVTVTRDIPYIDDGNPRHMLDIYAPKSPFPGMSPAPVLLQIHGGGWIIGNKKEQALPLMNLMSARGWVCVTVNYSLSPRATFPDHLIDVKHAVKWIRENIADYGGDPNFIVATGGSAGGHLSSLLTLTANDPELQPGFENVDTSMNGCVPFYGVYDFTDTYGLQVHGGLIETIEKYVLKRKLETDREAFLAASPMHRIHSDVPPMFVIHGDQDGLAPVEEARHFVSLLREASKSPVAYAEIPGAQHAFDIFHSPRSSIVIEGVARFLKTIYSDYKQHGASFSRGTPPPVSH